MQFQCACAWSWPIGQSSPGKDGPYIVQEILRLSRLDALTPSAKLFEQALSVGLLCGPNNFASASGPATWASFTRCTAKAGTTLRPGWDGTVS